MTKHRNRKQVARAAAATANIKYTSALRNATAPQRKRVVTAPGISNQSGPGIVARAWDAAAAAQETLRVPLPMSEWHKHLPAWHRRRLMLSNEASAIVAAVNIEVSEWFSAVEACLFAKGLGASDLEPGSFVFDLPESSYLTSILADRSMATRLQEPLPPQDRESQWAQSLMARLDAVRQQLLPLRGAPVDEVRAVVDHLAWWLAG